MDYTDCSILLDNESLYDICGRNLGLDMANYTSLNRIVAQVVSSITASLRFAGAINVDFTEFMTNLIPFPRIHFPICSYSPLLPNCDSDLYDLSTSQITQQVFQSNRLIKCDTETGPYICCCLLYRGNVQLTDINKTINDIKAKRMEQFVAWSPTSFKIGINYQPPTCVPNSDLLMLNKAVCMLSNKYFVIPTNNS